MAGLIFLWSGTPSETAEPGRPIRSGNALTPPVFSAHLALSADPSVLTDVSSRLMAFKTTRGRPDEASGFTSGTVQLDLDDDDGALDPGNPASSYYPYVDLKRTLQVRAARGGISYYLGTAKASDFNPDPLVLGANQSMGGNDLYKELQSKKVTGTFPAQTESARVAALLDNIGWSASARQLSTGLLTLPGVTLTSTPILEHLDKVMKAARGTFFIGGNGDAIYRNRHDRLETGSIGDFGAGGYYPIPTPKPRYNDAGLYNQVIVKRTAGATQQADDAASQAKYGVITYALDSDIADLLPDDAEARGWAYWLLLQRSQPYSRIGQIQVDPYVMDTLWAKVLGSEIGQKITLTHDLPGTKGLSGVQFYIEGITHEAVLTGTPIYTCTWDLSRAENRTFWILNANTTIGDALIVGH